MADQTSLIVGTYERLGGTGLVPLTLCGDSMVVAPSINGAPDASFGLWSSRWQRFFFVAEQESGRLVTCDADLRTVGADAAAGGAAPCHLAIDPDERLLAVANYESGSVALFRIDAGVLPSSPTAMRQLAGHGTDPDRQAGPHAHWVGFGGDGRWLYVVDLGTDAVLRLSVDPEAATLGEAEIAYAVPAGSGPRHLAFHPAGRRAYLVSELASTLTVLDVDFRGTLTPVQTLSTLPNGASDSLGGAIVINAAADRLYVTNRGHDSIAVFALNPDGATLVQTMASGGASPRFLLLLEGERRLLVANEEGGTVRQFGIEDDGRLEPAGEPVEIPGAVFLARRPG